MSTQLSDGALADIRQLAGKYLTFTLHCEAYGIDVLKVREIIRLTTITSVPQMPAYVRGVINLRGKIIPVMDLRLRFGFPDAPGTDQTCIIVVQVKLPDGKAAQMGLVVDGVEEVISLAASDIEETPDFGGQISTAIRLCCVTYFVQNLYVLLSLTSGNVFKIISRNLRQISRCGDFCFSM